MHYANLLLLPLALTLDAVRAQDSSTSVITTVNPGGGVSVTTSGVSSTTSNSAISTLTTVNPGGGISFSTVTTGSVSSASSLSVQPGGPMQSSGLSIAPSMGPGPVITNATRTSSGSMTSTATPLISQSSASTAGSNVMQAPFGIVGLLAGLLGTVVV